MQTAVQACLLLLCGPIRACKRPGSFRNPGLGRQRAKGCATRSLLPDSLSLGPMPPALCSQDKGVPAAGMQVMSDRGPRQGGAPECRRAIRSAASIDGATDSHDAAQCKLSLLSGQPPDRGDRPPGVIERSHFTAMLRACNRPSPQTRCPSVCQIWTRSSGIWRPDWQASRPRCYPYRASCSHRPWQNSPPSSRRSLNIAPDPLRGPQRRADLASSSCMWRRK